MEHKQSMTLKALCLALHGTRCDAHGYRLVLLATGVQGSAAPGGSASGCEGAETWRERKHCSRHLHSAVPGRSACSPGWLTTSVSVNC